MRDRRQGKVREREVSKKLVGGVGGRGGELGARENADYLVTRSSAVSVPHVVPFSDPRPVRAESAGAYCQPLGVSALTPAA